jgi:RNA polymerase sigma factor (sigma-70 family)
VTLPPFQAFFDANSGSVYRYLRAAVGPQEADDCFQETFISALRAYPELRHASRLDSWVMAIAHNKVIDHARATRRRPEPAAGRGEPGPETGGGEQAYGSRGDGVAALDGRATATLGADAGAATALLERDADVWEEVRALPPKQMRAVVLRHVNDLPYPEVARLIGCSEDAARRSVHEGLKKLREMLR